MNKFKMIAETWDHIVPLRSQDIIIDKTYNDIIIPHVINKLSKYLNSDSSIIDVGCGCGYLTNIIASRYNHIVGVDISGNSIGFCRQNYPQIKFSNEDIAFFNSSQNFDLCLAVMALHSMPDLEVFFNKIRSLLLSGGYLLILIPHPCFWPLKNIANTGFRYETDSEYTIPFSTKSHGSYNIDFIYFHRTLSQYINCFCKYNFSIIECDELIEDDHDQPHILSFLLKLSK